MTPRPRTWAVVREFAAADVADLNEVRSAFELLTVRLAAQRHHRAGLDRLRDVVEVELAAARSGDGIVARRAAADFHERVTELAGNELLNELRAEPAQPDAVAAGLALMILHGSPRSTSSSIGRSPTGTSSGSASSSGSIWRPVAP